MSSSSSSSANSDYLNKLTDRIVFHYLVVTVPLSMITKLISFYIYTRPNLNHKTNTGLLYLIFSIINFASLFVMMFIVRPSLLFGYQFNFICGLDDFIRTNTFNLSSWMQVSWFRLKFVCVNSKTFITMLIKLFIFKKVLISFDRYILISYPSKVAIMLKKKVLCSILTVMTLVILVLNAPYLVSYPDYTTTTVVVVDTRTNQTSSTTTTSTKTCRSISSVVILNNIIAMIMRVYLPFVTMTVLNLLAIRSLRRSRQRLDKYKNSKQPSSLSISTTASASSSSKMSSIEYRFTVSNLAIDFIFLIFYLPIAIFYALNIVSIFDPSFVTTAEYNLFANMAQMFAFTFHLIDIIIFLAFNPKIRDDLFNAIGSKLFGQKRISANVHNNNTNIIKKI